MANVAVVGLGYWGQKLARDLGAVATCDIDPAKSADVTHIGSLLTRKSIDAVAIATPARTHYQLARLALNADKDVLAEKPLATSVAEAEELVELAEERDRILMVDHTYLYHPKLPKRLRRPVHMRARRFSKLFPGDYLDAAWEFMPHDIAVAIHLMRGAPEEVFAYRNPYNLMMFWPDDSWAAIWAGFQEERIREMSFNNRSLKPCDRLEPLHRMAAAFHKACDNRKPPLSDGKLGLEVVRVLEKSYGPAS